MTAERRQHERVAASFPCCFVSGDGTEEPFDLLDLSETGARLKFARAIPAMTRVSVVLDLPTDRVKGTEDKRVETVGVVVWSHRGEDERFDTGVFFPELTEDQRRTLQAYVVSAG